MDVIKQINEEDNIYYHILEDENKVVELTNILMDNSVKSLYLLEIQEEYLLEKVLLYLKEYEVYTKHKYIFIDKNLPPLYKMKYTIKNYEDLKEIKDNCPLLTETSFVLRGKQMQYIITLVC